MPDSPFKGGDLYSVFLSSRVDLWKSSVWLNLSTATVYDNGGFGMDEGFLQKANAGLDWKISESLTLNVPSVTVYVPLSVHDARTTDTVIFAGATYRF